MSAMEIRRGFVPTPERIGLYGPEGVGKTTFASGCPGIVYVGTEDGGGDLDIARLPTITSWPMVFAQVAWLTDEAHDFTAVALDTIDHLEKCCWRWLCEEEKVQTIEAIGGGYGKGYTNAAEEMVKLQAALDRLRVQRRMRVIVLAHAHLRPFKNPDGPDYDRWTLRMHDKAAAAWKEWCDVLLFADYDVKVVTATKGTEERKMLSRGKATGESGTRRLYTTRSSAYDAKNRFRLPEETDLSWSAFATAMGEKLWVPWPAVVPEGHHPSFTEAEAKAFAAGLGKLAVNYDTLAAWLQGGSETATAMQTKLGVPPSRPSQWESRLRKGLYTLVAKDPAKFIAAIEAAPRQQGD